jgi:FkbM family methyltransferase
MTLLQRTKQRLVCLCDYVRFPGGTRFYSQSGEDGILAHLLYGHSPGFYVDVGAFHPVTLSNTYYFYQRGWMGINIEPTPGQIDLFKKLRPRDINLACAVAKTEGRIYFTMFDDAALNSAKKQMIDRHVRTWQLRTTGEIVVEAYPLAEIVKSYMPPGRELTFLSVDVEGMELDVLESHDWDRFRPRFIAVEWLEPLSVESAISSDVHRFLEQQKYELICKTPLTLIYCESEIGDGG